MWRTACTLITSAITVLVQSTAGGLAGKVLIAVVAPVVLVANLLSIAELLYHKWFARHVHPERRARDLPWRLLRLIDHYLAYCLSWALLFLVYWVWDDSANRTHYYVIVGEAARTNVWAAWEALIVTAFQIFNGVGLVQLVPNNAASTAALMIMGPINQILHWVLFGILLSEFYEHAQVRIKKLRSQQSEPLAKADDVEL